MNGEQDPVDVETDYPKQQEFKYIAKGTKHEILKWGTNLEDILNERMFGLNLESLAVRMCNLFFVRKTYKQRFTYALPTGYLRGVSGIAPS